MATRGNVQEEPIDPWAGKSLGEVSKPEGFDDFWADHEAAGRGEQSNFMAKQEELVRSEDVRLGESQRSRGRGRGRGRRGYQRYSRPEPQAPRARPSHFVAIRLYSRMIRRNVEQMQRWFLDKEPLFEKCVVPVKKLHYSLLLTAIPNERRAQAQEACEEAGREVREFLGDQPVKIIASGVGHFNGQVLFTRVRTEPHEMLQAIHDALARAFMNYGFPVLDESAKAWLEEGEGPHDFKAHASFLKVSKALAHAKTDKDRRQLRQLRVTHEDIAAWKDVFFGSQLCHEFELLDMIGSTRDGYYPCVQLERLNDRPVNLSGHVANVSLTAGPLRTGCLRVECEGVGAGMELSACEAGYFVESIEDWPGQPDLRVGDAIVAIGKTLLLGLEESELERRFGESFENGTTIVVGRWETLQKTKQDLVKRAAERLLRPFRPAAESTSTELCKVDGLRYQLRTTAETFMPDPLSQPGGDPWAKAAEDGYEYPAYTGWGTEFKKQRATKVDSSRFLQSRAVTVPTTFASQSGAAAEEERTALHKRLRNELRSARSHDRVLEITKTNRTLLSLSNRSLALARLSACGFLTDELRGDQRLRDLLTDTQDDVEAVDEAQALMAPAVLSELVLALGRLGVRRPELFHVIATIARRAGIWTFSDNEVSALLEGFSRSRLSDEVLFQDAARLVVARATRLAPRLLSTMLTAFACSSISTEHMFFAAGDAVVACQRHYTSGLLAELADAFSRVRARHELLLKTVPSHFKSPHLKDRKFCSIEALVKLFSAYVDMRQGLGPDGFREAITEALLARRGELSAKLVRQILQAMARARWPNTALLDVSAEVAARDPKPWELQAMHECLFQLRVAPPQGFPDAPRSEQERRDRSKQGDGFEFIDEHEAAIAGDAAALESSTAVQNLESVLRIGRLRVLPEVGAGVDLTSSQAGYMVEGVANNPGQPDLQTGDVILAVGKTLLLGLTEEEMERVFGENFSDGERLIAASYEALRQYTLADVRAAAEVLLCVQVPPGLAEEPEVGRIPEAVGNHEAANDSRSGGPQPVSHADAKRSSAGSSSKKQHSVVADYVASRGGRGGRRAAPTGGKRIWKPKA